MKASQMQMGWAEVYLQTQIAMDGDVDPGTFGIWLEAFHPRCIEGLLTINAGR